jgi:hypothetical protein
VGGDLRPPTLGFVAACPKLTELTIVCPHPDTVEDLETGYFFDPVGTARSATSELVNACNALPYFDTFQIVHGYRPMYKEVDLSLRRRRRKLRERVEGAGGLVTNCLGELETRCRQRDGGKTTTVRVIELAAGYRQNAYLDSVKIEEYQV